MKKFCLFFCIIFTCIIKVFPQYVINGEEYEFRTRNLPQSEVNDIIQDKYGFIWIATLDGLYRYDGYEYKAYLSDGQEGAISTNMILSLDIDSYNNLWVGTYGRGLSRFDYETGEFINFPIEILINRKDLKGGDITAVMVDSQNDIWIGMNYGLLKIKFDHKENIITERHFFEFEGNASSDAIKDIYQDVYGNIWIARNAYTELVTGIKDDKLVSNKIHISGNIITGDKSAILVGGSKLFKIEPHDGTFDNITPVLLYDKPVSALIKDFDNIWVANRRGLEYLSQSEDNENYSTQFSLNKEFVKSLNSNNVSCLMTDSENNIWIGIRGGGLYSLNKKAHKFQNYIPKGFHKDPSGRKQKSECMQVRAVFEDSDGNLWLGEEEEGVFRLSADKNYNDLFQVVNVNSKYENRGYAFEETKLKNGRKLIWVGTSFPANLVAIDNKTADIVNYSCPSSLKMGFVFSIEKTSENVLWIATYSNGVFRLQLDNNGNVVDYRHFTIYNSDLSSNIIRSLYFDNKSKIWIGTDSGLNFIDINDENLKVNRITFSGDSDWFNHLYVLDIKEYNGKLLMGSMGNGLILYDYINNSCTKLTTKNGLHNNSIKTVLTDLDNNVWVSSNKGISRVNLTDNSIIHYGKDNGISEEEFSEICGVKRHNGELVLGSRRGILVFRGNEIVKNERKPKVFITDMLTNGTSLKFNSEHSELVLDYDDRNVAFRFTGLQLSNPGGLKYYYKLEGFDNEWQLTNSTQRTARYTNLPEGDYIFIVKASNEDGFVSEHPAQLSFTVKPPFVRSGLAYFIYFLLFVVLMYISYLILKAFYRKKKEVLAANLEAKQAEEITQYKLQFFTDVSHEFRTPLTLIEIPLESAINNCGSDKKQLYYLTLIRQNVSTLKILINQLLDFRKIERGKLQFNPYPVNVSDVVGDIYSRFKCLSESRNIIYSINTPEEAAVSMIDISLFEKVIVNVISNAFKYTPQGGSISVYVANDANTITVSVQDTGEGISEEELSHLFERFYQGKEHNKLKQAGTGIGLSMCKNIIDVHGGNIEIFSKSGEGTKCNIILKRELTEHVTLSEIPYYDILRKDTLSLIDDELSSMDFSNNEVKQETNQSEDSELHKLTLLIVEDNDQMRNVVAENLSSDFEVITAGNGKEGLEKCKEFYPNLIITDIRMPIMNGIDMCIEIKKDEEISHIPIIVLTANNSVKNRLDSYNLANVDSYLEKPFEMSTLRGVIKSILANRARLQEQYSKNAIISPEKVASTKTDLNFMTEIINIIKREMSNPELSVELIADEYGVSRTYLNRKIKAITGDTTLKFIRNIRFKYAAQLLQSGEKNVSETAWEIGYNDVNTFRLRFKEMFGVTPTSYLKGKSEDERP